MSPANRIGSLRELQSPIFWRDLLCEFLTTLALLTYITYVVFVNYKDGYETTPVQISLAVGFIVFMLVDTFSHFGGGQMNPAVTLSFVLRGDMTIVKGIFYLLVQCLGSASGSAIVYAIVDPAHRDAFTAVKPEPEIGPWRSVAVEVIITSMLCFVALSVTDPHRPSFYPMPGLAIGATIATGLLTAGTSTGGAMNPMAPFGPAVITKDFEHHWVYWVGPLLGSVAASVIYLSFAYVERKFTSSDDSSREVEDIDNKDSTKDGERIFLKNDVET